MITNFSFKLQQVYITVEEGDTRSIETLISKAMETYKWIYRNESKHDVLVHILVKREYIPNERKEG